jgi:CHASE3 domain sensor protein
VPGTEEPINVAGPRNGRPTHGPYIPLQEHLEKLADERDRRYAEVALEREKALRIKEEADRKALDLAREIQIYKDEKANQLREQINAERGTYVTRDQLDSAVREITATMQPLKDFTVHSEGGAAAVQQRRQNFSLSTGTFFGGIVAFATVVGLILAYAGGRL